MRSEFPPFHCGDIDLQPASQPDAVERLVVGREYLVEAAGEFRNPGPV
jgi:hypothetical protein